MSNELRRQIYNEFRLKETEDLLEIWRTNDREEWSELAFDVIQEILNQRFGELPSQEEFVNEQAKGEFSELEEDGLPEWEAKLLDDDNQPEFYDTLEVLELKDQIDKTAKAVIIIYGLSGLLAFFLYRYYVSSFFQNQLKYTTIINLISFVVTCFVTTVSIAVTYFPLKALVSILRILMEMEFRSRKAL